MTRNLDYAVAAALGRRVLARRLLGWANLSTEDMALCARIARREELDPEDLSTGKALAAAFWIVAMGASFVGIWVVTLGLGTVLGHEALGGPAAIAPAVVTGVCITCAAAMGFATVREGEPRPYDAVIEIVLGLLTVAVFLLWMWTPQ